MRSATANGMHNKQNKGENGRDRVGQGGIVGLAGLVAFPDTVRVRKTPLHQCTIFTLTWNVKCFVGGKGGQEAAGAEKKRV